MNFRGIFFLLLIIFILSLIISIYLAISSYDKKPTVCIQKTKCINVEIADDQHERTIGLMYRDNLPDYVGMLFIFTEEAAYAFWMKNMKIPIDIVWIDRNLNVVRIEQNVPPCEDDPCPKYVPRNK